MSLPNTLYIAGEKYQKATQPSTPANVFQVRRWGDPVLVSEAARSVTLFPPTQSSSNFQAIGLYNKVANGFGGVSAYLRIPHSDVMRLAALQVEDDFQDKKPGWNNQFGMEQWRVQKMSWMTKKRGTIYFYYHHADTGQWNTIDYMEWGTIALGNCFVQVEDIETFTVTTPDNKRSRRPMARLVGFRRDDWDRPLAELVSLGLVHRCWCVYSGDDIGDSPKGIVYSPFWAPGKSASTWTYISPTKPQPDAFYIPETWLLPK